MENTNKWWSWRTGIPQGDKIANLLQQSYGLAFHSGERDFFGMADEWVVQKAGNSAGELSRVRDVGLHSRDKTMRR